MVEMNVLYEGELHCSAKHGPSGNVITTDAPKDNQGRGEAFSPTDLVGAALGTCMLTLMGIYARKNNIDISGATAHVSKEMVVTPIRRIGKLTLKIKVPKPVPAEHRAGMENAAHTCPVTQSLHPDVQRVVTFEYAG
jgi:putative redox protein